MATIMVAQISGSVAQQRWMTTLLYHVASPPAILNLSVALARGLGLFDSNVNQPGIQIDPTKVIGRMINLMSGDANIDLVRIFDQYSATDFYATPISPALSGLSGAPTASPAITYKFTSSVVNRTIRPGQRAIPGVTGGALAGAGTFTEGVRNALVALGEAMTAVIEDTQGGNTISFTPCVCKKERYNVPNSGTPPTQAYRFYADKETQLANTAVGVAWTPKNTVRTQASRQLNRGI